MLYRLGDIEFKQLATPNSFTKETTINYVERERLLDKPLLQRVGGMLDTVDMDIHFHFSFTDVRDSVNKVRDAAARGESMVLISGTGFKEGEYVISRYQVIYEKTDPEGRLLIVDMSIQLKEFVSADKESDEALAARKKGFANISANPIQNTPTIRYQNPQSLAMRKISVTQAAATSGTSNLRKAAAIPALVKKYMAVAERSLKRAQQEAQEAKTAVDGVTGKITNAQQLKDNLDQVRNTITGMLSNYTEPNLPALQSAATILDQNINVLRTTAVQLSNVTALRK